MFDIASRAASAFFEDPELGAREAALRAGAAGAGGFGGAGGAGDGAGAGGGGGGGGSFLGKCAENGGTRTTRSYIHILG